MARLVDQDRFAAYTNALNNWDFKGYIHPTLNKQANDFVRVKLGITFDQLKWHMYNYVQNGGEIDEQPERRPEWSHLYNFHYDLRFYINNIHTYIETRLIYTPPFVPDEPRILVVNVHDR